MPESASSAVFLSYASQDAAAVARIADALRAAGVEVWFDQNELVGGDAWDAKIRKQIAECALFVPVISANTQARREGYFRLEWRLAAQRTHMMSEQVAFLLPVVVDDTRDAEADVPAEFKTVQWTRLRPVGYGGQARPDGDDLALAKFCARVQKLLGGEAAPASSLPSAPTAGWKPALRPTQGPRRWFLPVAIIAFGALAIAGYLALRPAPKATAAAPVPTAEKPAAPTAPTSEARKLVAQARALIDGDLLELRESFFLADELAQRAVASDPTDGEAWATAARVSVELLERRYETTPRREDLARQQVERALSLAPNSVESRLAQAKHLLLNNQLDEAERRMKDLVAVAPQDARLWLMLSRVHYGQKRLDEAWANIRQAQAVPGGSPQAAAAEASFLLSQFRYGEAKVRLEQNLAATPTRRDYLQELLLLGFYVCDLPAAKNFLEKIPARLAQQDAFISTIAELWLRLGDGDRALAELKRMPRDFFEDGWDWRPKGYLAGYAHKIAGRTAAAQAEWQHALDVVGQRLQAEPNHIDLLYWKSVLLALTGQTAAAKEALKLKRELSTRTNSWFDAIALVACGETEQAIDVMVAGWKGRGPAQRSDPYGDLLYAPWLAPIRQDPRIQALVKEQAAATELALKSVAAAEPGLRNIAEKSVAVLAFANLSDDKANEYFSDGISEELLNVLAKVPGLKVTARTSSFHFKGTNTPIPEIARQLGVAYVVEGSVRKAGNKVRITAQLIKAADGFHTWSDNFDRELKDIFAVQDEIAGLIANNLKLKLEVGSGRTQVNPEAYGLLLQGRFFARQESNAGRQQSIEFYRRALALEPGYALAWAEMAQAYIRLARFGGMMTADGMKEARTAAQKALELDPDQPSALEAMGWVQRTADWDWRAAQKTFQRALALAPEDSSILASAAILYFNVGRGDEAVALARQAVERDPLNAMAQINYADLLMQTGRGAESVEPMKKGLQLAPGIEEFRAHLAINLTWLHRFAEADAVLAQEPSESYRLWGRGVIAGARGDRPAVAKAREALVARRDPTMTGYVAMLFAIEGNSDEAFAWLERSLAERDSTVCWVKTATYYDLLTKDPRWPVFLRKLGLADDQLK